MKKLLFFLLLPSFLEAQTLTTKVIAGGPGAGNFNMAIWDPGGLPAKKMAVIFIPGKGQSGTDVTQLYVNGPLNMIKAGTWKPNFVVIGIQQTVAWPPGRTDVPYFVRAALKELLNGSYPIDPNQFILTGLSDGAQFIYNYIQSEVDSLFRWPAAVVPMSMSVFGLAGTYNLGTDALAGNDFRFAKIPFWGFCGDADGAFLLPMNRYAQLGTAVGWNIKVTTYPGNHCCWNTVYSPTASYGIYNWMAQYRSGVAPVIPTLQARLWIDSLTVHYPNTSVLLADSSKNAYYTTLQVSNSVAAAFPTRFSPMSDGKVLLANLTDGSYTISLIAADSLKHYDTASVKIRVYGPPACPVCPICPPPRKATGFTIDSITGKYSFTYDDGNP